MYILLRYTIVLLERLNNNQKENTVVKIDKQMFEFQK